MSDNDFAPNKRAPWSLILLDSKTYKMGMFRGSRAQFKHGTTESSANVEHGCLFTAKGIRFGLEICLDHIESRLKDTIDKNLETGADLPQIVLVPSAKLDIQTSSISLKSKNVHYFNVDGSGVKKHVTLFDVQENSSKLKLNTISLNKFDFTPASFIRDTEIQTTLSQEDVNKSAKMIANVLTLHPLYKDGELKGGTDPKKTVYLYFLKKLKFSLNMDEIDDILIRIFILFLINRNNSHWFSKKITTSFSSLHSLINSSIDFVNNNYDKANIETLRCLAERTHSSSEEIESNIVSLSATLKAIYYKEFLDAINRTLKDPIISNVEKYQTVKNPNILQAALKIVAAEKFGAELPDIVQVVPWWERIVGKPAPTPSKPESSGIKTADNSTALGTNFAEELMEKKILYKKTRMDLLLKYKLLNTSFFSISEALALPIKSKK